MAANPPKPPLKEEAGASIPFLDVLLNTVAVLLMLVAVSKTDTPPVPSPGNLVVEIRWPDGQDCDVDLWVQAPGERPVGYSNKAEVIFNLLRDDLGTRNDRGPANYEFAFSRGVPPGEYTVNVHLYARGATCATPTPVQAWAYIIEGASRNDLWSRNVVLHGAGQELTVARFEIDENGNMVGRPHDMPKPLRSLQ